MGIPGAKPFQVMERERRHGILYEKIECTPLRDGMDENQAVKLFAGLHKKILALHTNDLMPYQVFLIAMMGRKGEAPEKMIEKIRAFYVVISGGKDVWMVSVRPAV